MRRRKVGPWSFLLVLVLAARGAVADGGAPLPPFVPTREPNMNGDYLLAQTPGADRTQQRFPAAYRDWPGGARYFDVYSPTFSTLYSQVFWKGLDPVPLPSEVVERYKNGGVMAIIGLEADQVRRGAATSSTW